MTRTSKFLTAALVAGALIAGGVFVNSTTASQDDEQLATRSVQEYLNGYENDDIDTMLKYVIDTRVSNKAQLREEYEQRIKQEDRDRVKFISIRKGDGDQYVATLELSSKDFNPTPIQIPVVKDKGRWKIFVDGSVVVNTKH